MRTRVCALALLWTPLLLGAQQRDTMLTREALPRDIAREAADLFNRSATLRATGRLEIEAGRVVPGDIAVLNGPLTIGGHIGGHVLAINSDVVLRPGARIDGDLFVVGGSVSGRDSGVVGGDIRVYRQSLHYMRDGDRIVAEPTPGDSDDVWWRRWGRKPEAGGSKIQIASAGAYNRVEGLPVNLGPQIFRNFDSASVQVDAYAVLRTGSSFRSDDNDVGHNLRGEVRLGRDHGLILGARAYDVVDPVESWQLSSLEAGLAAGLFKRDYRDYFRRRGGSLELGVFTRHDASLTFTYADERWDARPTNDPWTLFNSDDRWRENPALDQGVFHLLNATLTLDSRSDESNPWAGWYALLDYELGMGHLDALAPTTVPRPLAPDGRVTYGRGFLDLRRYNRVSRGAQINFRVVAGGWLSGDPLPLERRLSVDGPGTLPGFEFRSERAGSDVSACVAGPAPAGYPAQCDRIALGQVEYRSSLNVNPFDWAGENWVSPQITHGGAWVLFADAGRGWLVGGPPSPLSYANGQLPPISSFRTDAGVGIDFSEIGVFVAKALSTPGEPGRVFVRIHHRF
jgi:hypothetical protein